MNSLPTKEKDIEAMAESLVEWSACNTAINIEDFALSQGFPPSEFVAFVGVNKTMQRAYEIAIRTLGSRRKHLAFAGQIPYQIVMAELPLYDPDYRNWLQNQKLAETTANKPSIIFIEDEMIKALKEKIQNS